MRIKEEAASFRQKRMKRAKVPTNFGIFAQLLFEFKDILRLKFQGISPFLFVFHSIAVSSLDVPLYAYRSSADDFCSNLGSLKVAFALRILREMHSSLFCIAKGIENAKFLMTQPLFGYA